MNTIDYSLLAKAQAEYEAIGYRTIEVPWRVSTGIINVTRPPQARGDYIIEGTDKGLIASGEQGFMSLMNKGILPAGRYQTITPCFRNEAYDDTHSKQFMKLELIEIIENPHEYCLDEFVARMVQAVMDVFKKLGALQSENLQCTQQHPNDPLLVSSACDIEIKLKNRSIELGSYGVRQAHFGTWAYGTGLAEPRFSKSVAALRST